MLLRCFGEQIRAGQFKNQNYSEKSHCGYCINDQRENKNTKRCLGLLMYVA